MKKQCKEYYLLWSEGEENKFICFDAPDFDEAKQYVKDFIVDIIENIDDITLFTNPKLIECTRKESLNSVVEDYYREKGLGEEIKDIYTLKMLLEKYPHIR